MALSELLEGEPLHSRQLVQGLFDLNSFSSVKFPGDIRIYCDHDHCNGVRRHLIKGKNTYEVDSVSYCFIRYICTNCSESEKIYTIKAELLRADTSSGYCTKIYQDPPFGLPIPKRLFKVIGEDNRQHFLQARRAIARGLGVGAYAYYRRIVENNKFALIAAVLEVARAINALPDQIELLEKAQRETQFSKALDMLQDVTAIPPVLLIEGHNPLALLHDLLSEGIHQLTDTECLDRAKDSEIVLFEIAERMQIALTERKAVKSAISSIMNRKNSKKASPGSTDPNVNAS